MKTHQGSTPAARTRARENRVNRKSQIVNTEQQARPIPRNLHTFTFRLTNLSTQDALFLGDICALFADPAQRFELAKLKAGVTALVYDQDTGHALPEKILFHPSDN